MIYLTSDIHCGDSMGGLNRFLEICTESDLLIILGDIEIKFRDDEKNRKFDEFFTSLEANIAFVDGNHDNHPYLNSLPTDTWCGGKVHRLTKNIVHLTRGGVYEIEGKTFFAMGGCASSQKWADEGLLYEGEDPSAEEIAYARKVLAEHGNKVDYILTHKYSRKIHRELETYTEDTLYGLMDYIDEKVEFRHWYAGHWHTAGEVDPKHTYVHEELVAIK